MGPRSIISAAVLALAGFGLACRDQPPPPTPRLVGTGSPAVAPEPREDATAIGGSGEEGMAPVPTEESLPDSPPPNTPNELNLPRPVVP